MIARGFSGASPLVVDPGLPARRYLASGLSAEPLFQKFKIPRILLNEYTVKPAPVGSDPGCASPGKWIEDTSATRTDQRTEVLHQRDWLDRGMVGLMLGFAGLAM